MQRAEDAGLTPTTHEEFETHTHAHLDVFINGEHIEVPGGIGIDTTASGVEENPSTDYPGKQYRVLTCDNPCLSPLHTHDPSGTLHTEVGPQQPPAVVVFDLGQFFTEWGVQLDASCIGEFCSDATEIAVYVNGAKQSGDPADIPLTGNSEIAVVIGNPPAAVPSTWDFQPGE